MTNLCLLKGHMTSGEMAPINNLLVVTLLLVVYFCCRCVVLVAFLVVCKAAIVSELFVFACFSAKLVQLLRHDFCSVIVVVELPQAPEDDPQKR